MRSTYCRDIIVDTTCKSKEEERIILHSLHSAIVGYGWSYQNAQVQQQRNAINTNKRIVKEFTELMEKHAPDVFSELESFSDKYISDKDTPLTKKKSLELAKKLMKNESLKLGIKEPRYNNFFSKNMEFAFIEWCDSYDVDRYYFFTGEHSSFIIEDDQKGSEELL